MDEKLKKIQELLDDYVVIRGPHEKLSKLVLELKEEAYSAGKSDIKGDVISIAGKLLRINNLPTEMDQIEWCKTTPVAERRRVIDANRQMSENLKRLAVDLRKATDSAPNKKFTASIQYGMRLIVDEENKIVFRDDNLSIDELAEKAKKWKN